jgi:tetratricopeptide (TPR) repeat protein
MRCVPSLLRPPVILSKIFSRFFRGTATRIAEPGTANADADIQQGYRCEMQGDADAAEQCYRRALAANPANADANYLMGALLGKQSRLDQAMMYLQAALGARQEFPDAHLALGNVHMLCGNTVAALDSYRRALEFVPDNAAVHLNIGLAYRAAGRRDDALRHLRRARKLDPANPDALKNIVPLLIELGRLDEALALLHKVRGKQPPRFETLKYLGIVLGRLHRPEDAVGYLVEARGMDPRDPEVHTELGIALRDLGRLDESLASYAQALAVQPDFVLARWYRTLLYLLRQDFARGWNDYDLRLVSAEIARRPVQYPVWDGAPLEGRSILVYGEQGIGDEIMFASCLPEIIAACAHCYVECSPRLETLFRRSFPAATVYAADDKSTPRAAATPRQIDVQIALGSIPRLRRRNSGEFPSHRGYLRADPARVARWRGQLAELGAGLKVGISWRGGSSISRGPARSIALAQWAPILDVRAANFIDLQYDDAGAEIAALAASYGSRVHRWPALRADYEDTAAMVSALDLVISIDTALVHLAGALGKPVWVMALFSPEWRYGITGDRMSWYPSMRIFRQPRYGAWEPVIEDVARHLARMPGTAPSAASAVPTETRNAGCHD